ncbi:MAG: pyridoxal 5'-phosphate synthase glutaminase subunit PdxT [Dehalococcoidales bacterium]|nr:MAG: pyridoxal 5'-phosphate synthase glutaminase subunit PdxT [Dehalococcoidales bacterium]
MKIGVLALQGAFAEHITALHRLEVETVPVRLPRQLVGLDGLIIPGGESTTITSLMLSYNLRTEISRLAENGLPILGTCAGMILLAREVSDDGVEPVSVMGITVRRNAFGRQRESFEADLEIPVLGEKPFPGVFIRAPLIEQVTDEVEVLARLDDNTIVAARQGTLLACAFHPELTDDLRFHRYFLSIAGGE